MMSMSWRGLTPPATWMTSGSVKQRTTWRMASVWRMWREELVAEAFALAGAFDDAGDVDELHGGGDDGVGLDHGDDAVHAVVGDGDDAHVGVDGAEGVVRRRGLGGGEGVEDGGFSHVGEADNSAVQRHGSVTRCVGVSLGLWPGIDRLGLLFYWNMRRGNTGVRGYGGYRCAECGRVSDYQVTKRFGQCLCGDSPLLMDGRAATCVERFNQSQLSCFLRAWAIEFGNVVCRARFFRTFRREIEMRNAMFFAPLVLLMAGTHAGAQMLPVAATAVSVTKVKTKKVKVVPPVEWPVVPEKLISADVRDGFLTVDGMVAKLQLNYEIQSAPYLYFFLPGAGTAVVSLVKIPDATLVKNAFHENTLTFSAGGHDFQVTGQAEKTLLTAEKGHRSVWVHMDSTAVAGASVPQMGYGSATHAPYSFPAPISQAELPEVSDEAISGGAVHLGDKPVLQEQVASTQAQTEAPNLSTAGNRLRSAAPVPVVIRVAKY